jgi:hypothetical protein
MYFLASWSENHLRASSSASCFTPSGWPITVPPQGVILIAVAPYISWDFLSGRLWSEGEDEGNTGNFFNNSNEPDYFMQCSGVALEIQSPVVSKPTT